MKKTLLVLVGLVMSLASLPCLAISEEQEAVIKDHCSEVKEQLKTVQKNDARARVNLGSRYETILSKFIVPLNVRLVENNLPSAELVENQNKFTDAKTLFNSDYISYQQSLEELVAMDCKSEPGNFYDKLVRVRQKRKAVRQDVLNLRSLISQHVKLVTELGGKV